MFGNFLDFPLIMYSKCVKHLNWSDRSVSILNVLYVLLIKNCILSCKHTNEVALFQVFYCNLTHLLNKQTDFFDKMCAIEPQFYNFSIL